MDGVKRRYADRFEWKRGSKRKFASTYIESDAFTGYVTLLEWTEFDSHLNELDDALHSGDITPLDHSLAHAEARRVQAAIREGRFAILDLADAHLAQLTDLLQPFGSDLAWEGDSR